TWLADVNRIVFPTPAKYLNRSLQLVVATDERIDLSGRCAFDQVDCKGLQRIPRRPRFSVLIGVDVASVFLFTDGRNSVRDVVEYGQTCDSVAVQKKRSVRMLCVEYRRQNTTAVNFPLFARLRLEQCVLQHA